MEIDWELTILQKKTIQNVDIRNFMFLILASYKSKNRVLEFFSNTPFIICFYKPIQSYISFCAFQNLELISFAECSSSPQAGGAFTFVITTKVNKKARLKKGDCALGHCI